MAAAVNEHVETFPCMGSTIRLIIGEPTRAGLPDPASAAAAARAWLEAFDSRLSRFRADSETTQLNKNRRTRVPASALLRSLVGAGIWAADRSRGLVDPTLLHAIEDVGYDKSRAGEMPVSLAEALAAAPERHPARPDPAARWREFHVDQAKRAIERTPGLWFDPGGVGKGLAADAVAFHLHGYTRFAVDCGGDVRVGGTAASWSRYFVNVADPLTGGAAYVLDMSPGAIATSGLGARLWRRPDGSFAHQLLEPASGEPAWTGLVSATALAPTTLEAEMLAKTAFLSGPSGARKVLAAYGGVTIRENGAVELHGPLARRSLRVRAPAAA